MRYLYFFLLSVFWISCATVTEKYLVSNNTCHYNESFFKITKEELTLNQTILNQLKNKEGSLILVNNNDFKNEFYNLSSNKIINYQTNKKLNIGKWIIYSKTGVVKSSEFIYINGTKPIHKETHYNEQGKIIKVIDYEKGYNICWTEAIEIVKKIAEKDIKKYGITDFNLSFRVDLNKFPNENPEWGITLVKNKEYEPQETKIYWVDGVTGKFLRTTKVEITHE